MSKLDKLTALLEAGGIVVAPTTSRLLFANGKQDGHAGTSMHRGWEEVAKGLGLDPWQRTPARERYEDGWYEGRGAKANGKPLTNVFEEPAKEPAKPAEPQPAEPQPAEPQPAEPVVDRSFIPACTIDEVEREVRQPTEFELKMTAAWCQAMANR